MKWSLNKAITPKTVKADNKILRAWRHCPSLFVRHQYFELGHCRLPVAILHGKTGKQAYKKQHLFAFVQNVLAEHVMFEKIGGGETSKQEHIVQSGKQCWSVSRTVQIR